MKRKEDSLFVRSCLSDRGGSWGERMLSVEEAIHCILESMQTVGSEWVPLVEGLSRVLATDVVAPMDLPPFSHATVDGFAIQSGDVEHASREEGVPLRVVETIQAGSLVRKAVKPGLAIRTMTGAPLPNGADAVVKEEDTSPAGGRTALIEIKKPAVPLENVVSAGEEVRCGEIVLKKGTILRPENIGILASLGLPQVTVFRQPEIALLSTGNELVGLGERLGAGRIFASSFYVLLAKIRESGCIPRALGIVGDDGTEIQERIRSGLAADAIITVGGTRQGDSDWVRGVYRRMGIQTEVDGVAMSPGISFAFGLLEGKPVFSLPGSPTASLVTFEELVRPSLLKLKGNSTDQGFTRPTVKMSLGGWVQGKRKLPKYILARVVLKDGRLTAVPIKRERRGAVMPMIQANGIVVLPKGSSEARVGQEVTVRLVDLNL